MLALVDTGAEVTVLHSAVNPEKVQGPDISVQFLGIVWRRQTKAIPEKVHNTIQQYPVATAVKQLQAFGGLLGFWRTFIPHMQPC